LAAADFATIFRQQAASYGRDAARVQLARVWTPHAGPQALACAATEDEVFYGGAKGPGKSDWILYGGLTEVHKPRAKTLILRETFPELQELMDRAALTFPKLRLTWHAQEKRWTHAGGGSVTFGYCSTLADVQRYQGGEWAQIRIDEWANLADANAILEELSKELRCPNPDVRRMIALTGNPGYAGEPDAINRFITPCGETGDRVYTYPVTLDDGRTVTRRRRFIPGKVTDNPVYANDLQYMATLHELPWRRRQQLLHGIFGLGGGRALDELDKTKHLVQPFAVPAHWTQWASYDWGFQHPFALCYFAKDEAGTVYLVESVHGHRLLPWEQAERIRSRVPATVLKAVAAGADCWNKIRAYGENTPTIAQTFADQGILLHRANTDRKNGLNNMREYLKWRGEDGAQHFEPKFKIMDTEGNRQTWATLESMVTDPKDQEDALKRDATVDGEGGDDAYDACRYGLAEWMLIAKPLPPAPLDPFAPETLAATEERGRKIAHDGRTQARTLPKHWKPPTGRY